MYNERLYSREGAAELLGISVSTLADYELGNTKVVPVDKVVLMADLYNAPELKTGYCKHECPICSYLPVATEAKGLEGITLRLMKRLDCDELNRILVWNECRLCVYSFHSLNKRFELLSCHYQLSTSLTLF